MRGISGESLRHRYLSEEDAERLYARTDIKPNPRDYCPTCFKEGTYKLNDREYDCDCELQLQLLKHYTSAGIGLGYQRLDWVDYEGDKQALEIVDKFWENRKLFFQKGLGLTFLGKFGTGKTMLLSLLAKDLVKLGYSVFTVKATSMIEMFTSGWRSDEERLYFQKKVKGSQVLILDDLGKEIKTQSKLGESTLDDVLRTRVQEGRSTLITTNLSLEEIEQGYGGATISMMTEMSVNYEFKGEDYRPKSNQRSLAESMRGETRPII